MGVNPSVGERAAVGGLTAQYLVAAEVAYQRIKSGSLEWVQLVDPDAGRVDDVLIASPGKLDAYQIKWAAVKSTYTFRRLLTGTTTAPSIWRQLAQGWRLLSDQHEDRAPERRRTLFG